VVEKDARFVEILKGEFGKDYKGRLEIIHQDILELKLDQWKPSQGSQWKVISNLPYYITAPILFYLISYRKFISKAILTMQKEVAARLTAAPGSKDYSRLTLGVRYAADVRHLFDIAPTCFTPVPEVDSSVVELSFHTDSQMPENVDEDFLFYVIRVAFSQRRKTLMALLVRDSKIKASREKLAGVFNSLELSPSVRGENLLLKDFFALAEKLQNLSEPRGYQQ
jgi:16S rRNA (adenine1518-N6/adenine1519-N6)-dimethyltransferase